MIKNRFFNISIICICISLLLSGCHSKGSNIIVESSQSSTNSEIPSSKEDVEENVDEDVTYVSGEMNYMTFEECLSSATHVIYATFTGTIETYGFYQDLLFTPVEHYKGDSFTENFYVRITNQDVYVSDTNIAYTESATPYISGMTYLLVLEKQASVYLPHDIYLPLGNIIITSSSISMYDGTSINQHSSLSKDEVGLDELTSYIINYLAQNPSSPTVKGDYIRSESLKDIVVGSSYIVKVTPLELTNQSDLNNTGAYICRVDDVLKGTITDQTLKTYFFLDTVEIGSPYIIMLNRGSTSVYYFLSSKNSVYPANDSNILQQIQEIIASE